LGITESRDKTKSTGGRKENEAFFYGLVLRRKRKLYGERNNTRYNTGSKAKRKTEDVLA